MIVLEYPRKSGGHKRLAQPHYVSYNYAAALVQVVCGDLDRRRLEVEQLIVELLGQLELADPRPRFPGEMVRHLEVDEVRVDELLASPAILDERG